MAWRSRSLLASSLLLLLLSLLRRHTAPLHTRLSCSGSTSVHRTRAPFVSRTTKDIRADKRVPYQRPDLCLRLLGGRRGTAPPPLSSGLFCPDESPCDASRKSRVRLVTLRRKSAALTHTRAPCVRVFIQCSKMDEATPCNGGAQIEGNRKRRTRFLKAQPIEFSLEIVCCDVRLE